MNTLKIGISADITCCGQSSAMKYLCNPWALMGHRSKLCHLFYTCMLLYYSIWQLSPTVDTIRITTRYFTEVDVLAGAPKECACVWTDTLHVCMRAQIVARWPPFVSWDSERITCSLLRSSWGRDIVKVYSILLLLSKGLSKICTLHRWNRLSKRSRAHASLASTCQIKFKMSDVGIFKSLHVMFVYGNGLSTH